MERQVTNAIKMRPLVVARRNTHLVEPSGSEKLQVKRSAEFKRQTENAMQHTRNHS